MPLAAARLSTRRIASGRDDDSFVTRGAPLKRSSITKQGHLGTETEGHDRRAGGSECHGASGPLETSLVHLRRRAHKRAATGPERSHVVRGRAGQGRRRPSRKAWKRRCSAPGSTCSMPSRRQATRSATWSRPTVCVTEGGHLKLFRAVRDRMMCGHVTASAYLHVAGLGAPAHLVEIEGELVRGARSCLGSLRPPSASPAPLRTPRSSRTRSARRRRPRGRRSA